MFGHPTSEAAIMPRVAAGDFPPARQLDRPSPPEDMSEGAAAIWRKTVASMKPTWFTPECHNLLGRYCGAMAEAKRLEAEFSKLFVTDPDYEKLTKHYDRLSALALSYARALRLTPKANRTTSEARDSQRSNFPRPWEG
jgi:hypothetical protein